MRKYFQGTYVCELGLENCKWKVANFTESTM